MRFVRNSLALALLCGALLSGCDGLEPSTPRQPAPDTAGQADAAPDSSSEGTGDDVGTDASDTGTEVSADAGDTTLDTEVDSSADTVNAVDTTDTTDTGAAVTNGCGGTGPLAYRGLDAGPGDGCGLCGDGELYCAGTGGLSCAGATMPNDCGGCGLVDGEIGTTCGLCGDGVWACGAGQAECVGDRPPNGCGGCNTLALEPGTECALGAGGGGVVVCSGRELSRCASAGTNSCGGTAPLTLPAGVTGVEPRPGLLYQSDCRRGVLLCEGPALVALEVEHGNACGGCDPLLGEPGTACGACGGVWSCNPAGGVDCIGGGTNACGGCAALSTEPGRACDAGGNPGATACISLEETACVAPGSTNACGGLGALTGPPLGLGCGACGDGAVVCDAIDPLRRSTVCEGASEWNACGGCGVLDATVGSRCGTCGSGSFACAATSLICSGDAGAATENICGGCSTLAANPGEPCGRCGRWNCDNGVVGRLRCEEPTGGCVSVVTCGNGLVEVGESCDDGNRATEACAYGEVSCRVCNALCQSVGGATSFCGDGSLDAAEVCDAGSANGAGGCSIGCTCSAGYHLESGFCTNDVRVCSLPNGRGIEIWTGSAYGACVATTCDGGYEANAGLCSSSLGTSCTTNAECASRFCSTAPVGTVNDRCAPSGMVWIPAGTFTMGSPSGEMGGGTDETQHRVTISRAFFMDQTEVTQGAWKALSGGVNPSNFPSCGDSCPIEQVDWYAAVAFANARSAAEGLTPCYVFAGCTDEANGWQDGVHSGCTWATFEGLACTGYRLPTESEWEYAARAGTTTATYGGNLSAPTGCVTLSDGGGFLGSGALADLACYICDSGSMTAEVARKAPNPWGLFDVLGNVWEWTYDWINSYPADSTDPTGPTSGAGRVRRGGSFANDAEVLRAARREQAAPNFVYNRIGFRLARTVPRAATCSGATVPYLGGCSADADADGVADVADNCAAFPNPDQLDFDRDGLGDLCDPDIDGDSDGNATDCDDFRPTVFSGAPESCDGQDNNCNGLRDDGATGCPCATATYGSHTYLVCSTQSLSWNDAENFCVAAGYHLVTVSDGGENGWLSGGAGSGSSCSDTCGYAGDGACDDGGPGSSFSVCSFGTDCTDCGPRGGFSGNFWIGYNDIASEGSFVWSSGAPLTFSSWNSGEPANSSNEDCTEFRTGQANWNDLNCATGHPFICETEP